MCNLNLNSLSSRQGIYFCANCIVTYVMSIIFFLLLISNECMGFILLFDCLALVLLNFQLRLKSNKSDISITFDLRNRVIFMRDYYVPCKVLTGIAYK